MKTHVNIKDFGALGDAVVALDCSISAGSNVLTSATPRFQPSDSGKQIVVYGAGPSGSPYPYPEPLSTIIETFTDAQNVVLVDSANVDVANSPRVVYGTDDTAAIQSALDQLAVPDGKGSNIGGVLIIPPGHYLTRGLILNGSQTDIVVGTGTTNATQSYNNVWLQGFGRGVSILENWDITLPVYSAVITLLSGPAPSNRPLSNIIVSDITIRQVLNAMNVIHAIYSTFTEQVEVRDCEIISGSYEGVVMSNGSRKWRVSGCDLHDCGKGGPAYDYGLSALNLGGSEWIAEGNEVRESGQGIEMGGHNNRVLNNRFYSPAYQQWDPPPPGGIYGIHCDSSVNGAWENEFTGNLFVGWTAPLGTGNTEGIARSAVIQRNQFINCGWVQIDSGLEENLDGSPGTDPHGVTIVKDNIVVRMDLTESLLAFEVGGVESVILEGNRVFDASLAPKGFVAFVYGYGGGDYWTSSVAGGYSVGDRVVPTIYNGCYYLCVKGGNPGGTEPVWPMPAPGSPVPINDPQTVPPSPTGVQWLCKKRPFAVLRKNILSAPLGASSMPAPTDVRLDGNATHEVIRDLPLTADNLWGSYQLGYFDWLGGPALLKLISGCG